MRSVAFLSLILLIKSTLYLVTGPARSGKSEWAEALAAQFGQSVIYVATSKLDPADQEWQRRIQQHRDRRPEHWQLWEVPLALPEAILAATAQDCLLVDSLGTWLANTLDQDDDTWRGTVETLLDSLQRTPSHVILVAEETGWGLVPAYPVGRLFRDRLGSLTRQVGAIAGSVYLVVAGYALDVRRLGEGVGEMGR
ncbi:bifunctional adenosylcobinamide kinase/adenosylcobinamide-phosphate guanylyltransferase [Nodosilinea sp. P-1105]|uniref:bifunctional adenosylcobinamide kinase/adenosylcobinamide-phosphate guanylyltransferase n=1 Tax=Nodosilinea sp. P-1105 TaxID=2546229 RepID=UPI00146DCF88|nr:bifunctional adenosylcobinamide kinase/adenosylcobinamide-phosphate guanylyltransferase [Nodosilinea sp. P-1105]NMF81815.1 bifunctional adenosylcobinamide kinase/adenosylcobinamide-phosphate guanylyltransferase [Nodosilinea sp. P-1105]